MKSSIIRRAGPNLRGFPAALLQRRESLDLEEDHTFLGVQEQVDLLAFLVREVVGDLHPDHGVVDVSKEKQKISKVRSVGDDAFE